MSKPALISLSHLESINVAVPLVIQLDLRIGGSMVNTVHSCLCLCFSMRIEKVNFSITTDHEDPV